MKRSWVMFLILVAAALFADGDSTPFLLPIVFAHCDTLDGPVVKTARAALEQRDVTPILKWVKKENEAEIKDLFQKTLSVRSKGKDARELADMYFLETLVRLHRAGEGERYTGVKPAGVVEPAVLEADKALESGSVEALIQFINEAASKGIRERFERAKEAERYANNSVEGGRAFVEAYVQFIHYVERLHLDSTGQAEHRHGPAKGSSDTGEHHEH